MKKVLGATKVVILINGSIENPQDDESKQMISKINATQCEYAAIDIVKNKAYLEFLPKDIKIPFVFLSGKAACGIDGIDMLKDSNEFKTGFQKRKLTTTERIEELLSSSEVLLFMKGSPSSPQCGFSSKIVDILKKYDGLEYKHFNIFEDNEIREGLKKYSNWPTYP